MNEVFNVGETIFLDEPLSLVTPAGVECSPTWPKNRESALRNSLEGKAWIVPGSRRPAKAKALATCASVTEPKWGQTESIQTP
ncbi:hypothetical protein [Alterinioella nitratireducens]|uniref:hypothetical protein n=1 Tax=Alterinioella nitratireducens TaxID=2735915 RepID=UPI0040593786